MRFFSNKYFLPIHLGNLRHFYDTFDPQSIIIYYAQSLVNNDETSCGCPVFYQNFRSCSVVV